MARASRGRPLPFQRVAMLAMPLLLGACAHTTATLEPGPQVPVCSPAASALILWAPVWRPDQKDAASREAAAALGLDHFFAQPGCFASTALQRVADLTPPSVAATVRTTVSRANSEGTPSFWLISSNTPKYWVPPSSVPSVCVHHASSLPCRSLPRAVKA